jgi:hypothetical protein
MKTRRRIAALFLLAVLAGAIPDGAMDAITANIPAGELRTALARDFPSWKPVRCVGTAGGASLYTVRYAQRPPAFPPGPWSQMPCRVDGDFDGDGTLDAAVQLERRDGSSPRTIVVVVFRRQGTLLTVYAGEGDDTLGVAGKGTIDHDYETDGAIRYENDAIYVGHDETAGVSLVYRNGRFLVFVTGD